MIFREPLRSMLHPMATELCGIWLATESEQRFMKIRRFPTMHRKEEALAIEPMINAGTWQVRFLRDGWTVVTKDGSLSAHYENTILVTDGEPEILTLY